MDNEDKICLCGDHAKQFLKNKIGDKVELTILAVITKAGLEDYTISEAYGLKDQRPMVELAIVELDSQKKSYDEMNASEMEQEIHDFTHNEMLGKPKPNREDGGSIWEDMKLQEKVGRAPFKRPPPFGLR